MIRRTEGRTSAPRKPAAAAWATLVAWAGVAASPAGPAAAENPTPEPAHTAAAPLAAAPADTRAATALLHDAVVVRPGGRHHRLLRALRFLEDPQLAPLFHRLRENEHAALRVHGLLGIAELATPRGVTTENLVDLERDDQRAEVIAAALDGGLLDDHTLDELLAWPGLDDAVKLLLATPRVAMGRVAAGSPAHAAMVAALDESETEARSTEKDLGRRGLAALLLHQMGDHAGTRGLIALSTDAGAARDPVRGTLLETAREHGLDRAGTWAYSVASEPGLPPRLADLALAVAAEFGDARAHRRWREQVQAAHDRLPRRTRLALAGLGFARAAEPAVFDLLVDDPDPLVAAAGRAARGVADRALPTPALVAALDNLHATGHPLAHAWLAAFAADPATPNPAAVATARRLVTGFAPGSATGRTRRLQAVLDAVETLLQRDPEAALVELPRVLADAGPAYTQAVLLGLIRSRTPAAAKLARRVAVPNDPDAQALALVLRLRSGGPVGPELRATLTQVLGGQTALDDELRVQAAWAYLKRTDAADAVSTLPADAVARTIIAQ